MIPDLYSILNVASVNTHVSGRIFGAGHADDSPTYPYITWQVVSGRPKNFAAGAPNCDNARVQINVWARTEEAARLAATAVRDVMDAAGYQRVLIGPEKDPQTKSIRIQMDYSLWTDR